MTVSTRLGIVGYGRMGSAITRRLLARGFEVVVFDRSTKAVSGLRHSHAEVADSLPAMVASLDGPRVVWTMVPAGAETDAVVEQLASLLERGDTVVDAGNSHYRDTLRWSRHLAASGIHLVDVGTSGGIQGEERGFSLAVGGDVEICARLRPLLEGLASTADSGWAHVGEVGSGHFVKMVHNAIEYGLMQAYAEGFALLKARESPALNLQQVARVWASGSIIRSWLLDLITESLEEDAQLEDIEPWIEDSGQGRWAVAEALKLGLSVPVIAQAVCERLSSRQDDSFSRKLLSVVRHRFGGHEVKKKPGAKTPLP